MWTPPRAGTCHVLCVLAFAMPSKDSENCCDQFRMIWCSKWAFFATDSSHIKVKFGRTFRWMIMKHKPYENANRQMGKVKSRPSSQIYQCPSTFIKCTYHYFYYSRATKPINGEIRKQEHRFTFTENICWTYIYFILEYLWLWQKMEHKQWRFTCAQNIWITNTFH